MFLFGLAAVWTSVKSYQIAQREINDDLQQALTLTKAEAPADWFTTDTIRQFRSHIVSPELRQEAQLAFLLSDDGRLHVRGYVSYSSFQVWRMSDQRWALYLSLLAMVCMALSLYSGPCSAPGSALGGYIPLADMHMTPMQERLVQMFLSSPRRELTKQEICSELRPGKPDASETLYTLIRRTKQALEAQTRYRIESRRGKSYFLKEEGIIVKR